MTVIKQDCVILQYSLLYTFGSIHVFKLFTGNRVSEDFQFRVSGSRNNRKRIALVWYWTISENRITIRVIAQQLLGSNLTLLKLFKLYYLLYALLILVIA